MSKYTTEVRYICEEAAGYDESQGYSKIDTILTKAAPKVFDFDFPIFDESYRLTLEKNILRHYYTREIGEETVGLWKLRLWDRMATIMPLYNKLYLSETLSYNPLYDVDYTKTSTTDHTGSTTDVETRNLLDTTSSTRTDNLTRTDALTQTTNMTRTDNLLQTSDMTRIDDLTRTDNLTQTNNLTRTDDLTRTDNLTRTDDLTRTDSFTETKNLSDGHSGQSSGSSGNTHYDLYSDTPQGALTGVDNETYLTNARKITDSGTTSGSDSYIDTHTGTDANAGTSKNTGTQTNTGTVKNTGTETNTGTVKNTGTETNTGTQRNAGTVANTGTETNAGTVGNTGTVTNTGTVQDTGTVAYTGTDSRDGTVANLTEYTERVLGKQGGASYAAMIREYRESLINIDRMVLDELSDLFINLW